MREHIQQYFHSDGDTVEVREDPKERRRETEQPRRSVHNLQYAGTTGSSGTNTWGTWKLLLVSGVNPYDVCRTHDGTHATPLVSPTQLRKGNDTIGAHDRDGHVEDGDADDDAVEIIPDVGDGRGET